MQNIYQKAQEIVENESQWFSGQRRVVWEGTQATISIVEGGRDGGGELDLQISANGKGAFIRCGHLDFYGWVWDLTENEYKSWVKKAKVLVNWVEPKVERENAQPIDQPRSYDSKMWK